MRISDGSSDVCSSDLAEALGDRLLEVGFKAVRAADGLQSLSQRYRSPLGELQIVTQVMHRLGRRPREIDHRRIEAREDHHLGGRPGDRHVEAPRSEEHTSELQSLMRISYAVFCLKKKTKKTKKKNQRRRKNKKQKNYQKKH